MIYLKKNLSLPPSSAPDLKKRVDKCFVPSDALYKAATDRNVSPSQIVQHGLPIRKGFWSDDGTKKGSSSSSGGGKIASPPSKGWFSDLNLNLGGLMGGGGGEKKATTGGGGGEGEVLF